MNKTQSHKNNKSLVLLGSQMETAGAQHVLLAQAEGFEKNGYKVTVIFLYDKENLYAKWSGEYPFPILNVRARIYGAPPALNMFLLLTGTWRVWRILLKGDYDIIETFTHHSNLVGIPLGALAGIPVRIASHHGRISSVPSWLERIHGSLIKSGMTDCLVAVSERVKRIAVEKEKVNPDNIEVIENGISMPIITDNHNIIRSDTRRKLGVTKNDMMILSVGRITEQKGHKYLIKAVFNLRKSHDKLKLFIAGEGELRFQLQRMASDLGIDDLVIFLGNRPDIPQLLAAADIFVLPSLSEGLSLALLEAMGSGLPVVASRVEGVETLLTSGINGLVIPPKDVEALSKKIQFLINNPEIRRNMGQEAKKLVSSKYTVEVMCKKYDKLFLNLLEQKCKPL